MQLVAEFSLSHALFLQEHITNQPKRVASRSSLEKLESIFYT
jgi:hypothetical protein